MTPQPNKQPATQLGQNEDPQPKQRSKRPNPYLQISTYQQLLRWGLSCHPSKCVQESFGANMTSCVTPFLHESLHGHGKGKLLYMTNTCKTILTISIELFSQNQSSTMTNKYAVTDPYWQVSDKYKPDKTDLWKHPVEKEGWVMAHNALRGEIRDFDHALQILRTQPEITDKQVKAMERWWDGHIVHLTSHHENEDKIVAEFVKDRFKYPEFMATDHDGIHEHTDNIAVLILEDLKKASSPQERTKVVNELCEAWRAYSDDLLPHLKAEEDDVIPLVRAYFTPEEMDKLGDKLIKAGPPIETGSFIYYNGKANMKELLKRQGVPRVVSMFLWLLLFNPRLGMFKKSMLDSLEILRKGSEN